jgi:hypothetical protein
VFLSASQRVVRAPGDFYVFWYRCGTGARYCLRFRSRRSFFFCAVCSITFVRYPSPHESEFVRADKNTPFYGGGGEIQLAF